MSNRLSLCQVAISTIDLGRTHHWYEKALGMLPAAARQHMDGGVWAVVPGLPEATFDVCWLVDRQPFVQLEIFEFARPPIRRVPEDWSPHDIGYVSLGLHVVDFDAALRRLAATSGRLLAEPRGVAGHRRAYLFDPDRILLELLEDGGGAAAPGREDVPVAVRSVTLSVPELARARRFWIDTLGFAERREPIHTPEQAPPWPAAGGPPRTLAVDTGAVAIELVEHVPAGRARPAGRLLSDQGILNVALGTTDKQLFLQTYDRAERAGYRAHRRPLTIPGRATVVYLTDDQGFSVELMHVDPEGLDAMGFMPSAR